MITPEQLAAAGTEHAHQAALFQWIATQTQHPLLKLCFAIPNGGHRSKATAARLKAEGVKAGVPDIFLPVARGGFHGLFIEMKIKGGRLSAHQDDWYHALRKQGYSSRVCFGWVEAKDTLNWYMELK